MSHLNSLFCPCIGLADPVVTDIRRISHEKPHNVACCCLDIGYLNFIFLLSKTKVVDVTYVFQLMVFPIYQINVQTKVLKMHFCFLSVPKICYTT